MEAPSTPGTDLDEALAAGGGIAALIVELKPRIFDRFVLEVREAFPAGHETLRPIILNALPAFLTSLGLALSPHHTRRLASDGSTVASAHGEERAMLTGYSLDDLIHEYQVFRSVLFEELTARVSIEPRQIAIINESIDTAIREATSAFVRVYDGLRGQIAATLTHDLRGPLGAAYTYIHLLERAGDTAEARSQYCAGAMRNLGRVRQMIDDLLDHSRASAGERLPLRLEPLELGGLVKEVLSDLRAANGDRYQLNVPGPIEGVWCADALKRAVHNLAENATKYGEPDSQITVNLSELQGNVYLSVHNRGTAIPDEERVALFEAFRRGGGGDRDTGPLGWGLGLTAVKEIAAAHGGSVIVESSESEGTTFTLQVLKDASVLDG